MILTTLKNLYYILLPDKEREPSRGLWYTRKVKQILADGTEVMDNKRSQYWTNRESLLNEYRRRCPRLERLTPFGAVEPPDACLYRWWDDEEYDLVTEAEAKGGWRYFYLCREKGTNGNVNNS